MSLLNRATVKGFLWLIPTLLAWTCLPASSQTGSGTTDGIFGDLSSDDIILYPEFLQALQFLSYP